jgi:CspA family cold shock protein
LVLEINSSIRHLEEILFNLIIMKGIIKKISENMFGFISVEGEKDLFFHANDCTDSNFTEMNEGDSVSFTTEDSPKGPRAVNVQLAGAGEEA